MLLLPASARAVVAPALTLDGPSADVLDLGGVAMAPDGTGGAVWRRLDEGRAHIFAAAFRDGAWTAPQRVDTGATQRFASSWPAIGAGNGGRLVVAWVQEFGVADRLFSATLQPGARRFEPPLPVDLNVGDSALGTWPQIAMAPGGQALLTYRVITDPQPGSAPPGNVLGEIRAARLTGQLWSGLGAPLNRNPAAAQPVPSAANRPRAGIEQLGSGVVAWTELDDEFVPRIYARRIFGNGSVSIARQVSPRELAGVRQRAVEAFDLSVGRFGEAAIAWRQTSDAGQPSRAFLSTLPDQFAADAATFSEPRIVDGGGASAPAGLGIPSVSTLGGATLIGLGAGGAATTVDVSDADVAAPVRIDKGDAAADPLTRVSLSSDGGAALAFRLGSGGRQSVRLLERREDGAGGDRVLAGPRGGAIDELLLAGSGAGDALAAFTQGTGAGRQLVVGAVDAAPHTFSVQTPLEWVRADEVPLRWDPAVAAIGRVRYSVVVEDDVVAEDLRATRTTLETEELDDGELSVAVVATDAAGQETSSVPATLKLDRTRPRLQIKRLRGRRVELRVVDGRGSGANAAATSMTVRGKRLAGRTRRAVRLPVGRHRVVVRTADKAGNRATLRRTVVVR